MLKHLLSFCVLFSLLFAYGCSSDVDQAANNVPAPFTIDPSIDKEVNDYFVHDDGTGAITLMINEDGTERDWEDPTKRLTLFCTSQLRNDSIHLSFWNQYSYLLFHLQLHKDKFNSSLEINLVDGINGYKEYEDQPDLQEQLITKAQVQSMVLTKAPQYDGNERLVGIVEFTTNTFYASTRGEMVPYVFRVKAWFAAMPTEELRKK